MAITVTMSIDQIPCITKTILKESIPKILASPRSLYNLLRIVESRKYGIPNLIAQSCSTWSVEEWKKVEQHVNGNPKLASILVSHHCLELLSEAENLRDSTFQTRYEFALKLCPLPPTLATAEQTKLFLENIPFVDEYQRFSWFEDRPFPYLVEELCENECFLKSGITHHFIVPMGYEDLSHPETRTRYDFILKKICQPEEFFGHIMHIRSLLKTLEFDEVNQVIDLKVIKQFLEELLKNLEERLLHITYDNSNGQSTEEFHHHMHSKSKEELIKEKDLINNRLRDCDSLNFQWLAETIVCKLGKDYKSFFSEDNSIRLWNCPYLVTALLGVEFDKRDRTTLFNRWNRELPDEFLSIYTSEDDIMEWIYSNMFKLPLYFGGLSLQDFLHRFQVILAKEGGWEIEVTIEERQLYINVERDVDIESKPMNAQTRDFILLSLVLQLYFQSSETFQPKLLEWITICANKENPGFMHVVKNIADCIYS